MKPASLWDREMAKILLLCLEVKNFVPHLRLFRSRGRGIWLRLHSFCNHEMKEHAKLDQDKFAVRWVTLIPC